jgi:hypothetical protein
VIACKSAQALTTGNSAEFNATNSGVSRATLRQQSWAALRAMNVPQAITFPNAQTNMDIRISYERSLATASDEFIANVASQVVTNIPANMPRVLLPEFIASLTLNRSPAIGKIRNLRILGEVPSLQ